MYRQYGANRTKVDADGKVVKLDKSIDHNPIDERTPEEKVKANPEKHAILYSGTPIPDGKPEKKSIPSNL